MAHVLFRGLCALVEEGQEHGVREGEGAQRGMQRWLAAKRIPMGEE